MNLGGEDLAPSFCPDFAAFRPRIVVVACVDGDFNIFNAPILRIFEAVSLAEQFTPW